MTKETMNTEVKTVESLVCRTYGFFGSKKKLVFDSLSGTIQEKNSWSHSLSFDGQNRQSIDRDMLEATGCLFRTLEIHLTTQDGNIYEIELSAMQTAEYIEYKQRLANNNLSIDSVVTRITPYQNLKFETDYISIKFEYLNDCEPIKISETVISPESQAVYPTSFIRSSLTCCACGTHSGLFFIRKRDKDYTTYICVNCKTITLICSVPWGETPGDIPKCSRCGNENGSAYVVYSAQNMFEHFCSICHENLDHSRHALINRSYILDKRLLGKNLCGWEDL